jgi:hypothetical protein
MGDCSLPMRPNPISPARPLALPDLHLCVSLLLLPPHHSFQAAWPPLVGAGVRATAVGSCVRELHPLVGLGCPFLLTGSGFVEGNRPLWAPHFSVPALATPLEP